MANKYCNLDGSKKIKYEYPKISEGFRLVQMDILEESLKESLKDINTNNRITTLDTTINNRIKAHTVGLAENHTSVDIRYEGDINKSNVKQALDFLNTRVNSIIQSTIEGVSVQEIVDARGSFPLLGNRLDTYDTKLDLLTLSQDYGLITSSPLSYDDYGGV